MNLQQWLRRLVLFSIPDLAVTRRLANIGPFRYRLRQHRAYWLHGSLRHQEVPLGFLSFLIQPGQTVYDVGANIGFYSRYLLDRFEAGTIVAFEPMRANLVELRHNLSLSPQAKRATIVEAAIGDTNSIETLQIDNVMSQSAALDRVRSGQASAGRLQLGLPPRTESITVRTLDDWLKETKHKPPDVIKIDVEGAEALVLQGAEETLRDHRPSLVVELHGIATVHAVVPLLHQWGYTCFSFMRRGELLYDFVRLSQQDVDRVQHEYEVEFILALPSERTLNGEPTPFPNWQSYRRKLATHSRSRFSWRSVAAIFLGNEEAEEQVNQ